MITLKNTPKTKATFICGDKSIKCENFLLLLSNRFWRNILNEDENVIILPEYDFYIVQDLFEILLKGNCYFESLHDLEQFEDLAKNISLENFQSNNNDTKKDTTNGEIQ